MANRNLLLSALRRSRPLSTLSRLLTNSNPNSLTAQPANAIPPCSSLASFHLPFCRFLSTRTESESINFEQLADPVTEEGVVNGILPVDAMISLLDSYHDLTGLPWSVDNHCFINTGNENNAASFTCSANAQDQENLSGGALWFQNLTELPHGVLGAIFPFLIASLHGLNVQYYKKYLNFLMLPLFFIGYCIPQGSLVYWVTNSSFTAIQQASLKHPVVRAKLGLLEKDSPKAPAISAEMVTPELHKVSPENLSPHELLAVSGDVQALLQEGLHAEATDHLERAISKLILSGHPTAEDVDHLILASQWAGVACIRQEKNAEGIMHLERITSLEEPEDPKSKAHYFDGLLLLARFWNMVINEPPVRACNLQDDLSCRGERRPANDRFRGGRSCHTLYGEHNFLRRVRCALLLVVSWSSIFGRKLPWVGSTKLRLRRSRMTKD
ncbi:unnamed protein product [Dovyalis caffra]|uniref:Uncharacterized protein n=1 Tax=Dovyalis caffra TaxID=77055 RepID=A0AAV1RAU0_9ROSI|nr:unnamed protein product [Dovyalis caffra]